MSTFWPLVVIGLFTGSIYGLGALGLVLTYKTTGVFNFAFGAVAMFCAFVYWQIHDTWHWTAWISIPLLLLVVAPLIGYLFELLFRPLSGLAAEVPIVVSLALLALLEVGAQLIWGGQERGFETIIPTSSFKFGSFYVGWDQLGTLIIAFMAGGFLWWLLRHTRFGMSTRAVVDNRDLAAIIGVSGDNVRRFAWMVSSTFAALLGILLTHSQELTTYNLVLVVLVSFAPAVMGRNESFPWAFGGALGLGVFTSVLHRWSTSGTVANIEAAVPWFLLFIFLIVLGGRLKEPGLSVRPMAVATGTLSTGDMEHMSARPRIQRAVALGVGAFAVAAVLPTVVPGPQVSVLTYGALWALMAVTLVVLTGWAGQISIAQVSFVGVGAFAVGHWAGAHGQNFVPAALAGMAIAVPLGLIVGIPSLRLRGLYLALATLAFALIMDYVVFNSVGISGGLTGILDHRPRIFGVSFASTTSMYELSLGVLGVVLAITFALRQGPIGRRLRILRDSPLAASTLGVNLTVTKLVTFAVCGVVAAMAGALYGSYLQSITPINFQFGLSVQLLLLVVFAGRSVLTGAVVAGVLAMIPALIVSLIGGGTIGANVGNWITLAVAVGVIGLGRNPEGTVSLSIQEAKRTLSVMRPRPRRYLGLGSPLAPERLEVSSGG